MVTHETDTEIPIWLTIHVLNCSEGTENRFTFYIIPPQWQNRGSWNPSSCKIRTRLFYMVITMTADGLATQGAKESTTMLFTMLNWINRSSHVKGESISSIIHIRIHNSIKGILYSNLNHSFRNSLFYINSFSEIQASKLVWSITQQYTSIFSYMVTNLQRIFIETENKLNIPVRINS